MTNHEISSDSGHEEQPEQQLIANLLPRYYETHGTNPSYETVRSIMIDGHEVAWMEYSGEVAYDITGQGNEGKPYVGRELHCACHFTEGVGWRQEEDGRVVGLMGKDHCIAKEAALHLRHLELRQEYKARGMLGDFYKGYLEEVPLIMADLMEKVKAGEFLEGTSGAHFWGGYYYLQTVASIADIPMKTMWEVADKLLAEKKISLEGNVVQEYREPNPPAWEPHTFYEQDGWVVSAALPTHSKMPQEWRFEVTDPEGNTLELEIPNEPLSYQPTFGPDVEDVRRAEERVAKIMEEIAAKPE